MRVSLRSSIKAKHAAAMRECSEHAWEALSLAYRGVIEDLKSKAYRPKARDLRALMQVAVSMTTEADRAAVLQYEAMSGDGHEIAEEALGALRACLLDPDTKIVALASKAILDGLGAAAARDDHQLITRLREAAERAVRNPEDRQRLAEILGGGSEAG